MVLITLIKKTSSGFQLFAYPTLLPKEDFDWAIGKQLRKKKLDFSKVEFFYL